MADVSPSDGQMDDVVVNATRRSGAGSRRAGAETERSSGSGLGLEVDWDAAKVPKTNLARRGAARGTCRSRSSGRQVEVGKGPAHPFMAESSSVVVVDDELEVVPRGPEGAGERVEVDGLDADALRVLTKSGVADILEVCRVSGNLKGTCIKTLKKAANSLKDVVEVLLERTVSEETARLGRETRVLRQQVEDLKKEVLAWRREASERRVMPPPPAPVPIIPPVQVPQPPQEWEKLLAEGFERMERSIKILDARFDGLEADGRLLPKKVLRPPLAAEKRPATVRPATVRPAAVPGPSGTAGGAARPRSLSRAVADRPRSVSRARPVQPPAPAQQPLGMEWAALPATAPARVATEAGADESWTTVVRRPKKTKAAPAAPAAPVPKKKAPPKVPSAPRSAAVLITLQPEAAEKGVTYTAALLKAREAVGLAGLGIEEIKLRTTATGARIVELPGSQGEQKAAGLAEQLKVALADVADITRPVKRAELRIVGLDESVSQAELRSAIGLKTGCGPDMVRVGPIRQDWGGGVAFVSLPVAEAKKLAEAGRLLVGWSVARVHPLDEKPMRCFKCMGLGHTRNLCESTKDRSALCYRCGGPGHTAATCAAVKLHCAVCADAGIPAEHYMGGGSCRPPSVKRRPFPGRIVRPRPETADMDH